MKANRLATVKIANAVYRERRNRRPLHNRASSKSRCPATAKVMRPAESSMVDTAGSLGHTAINTATTNASNAQDAAAL